MKEITIFYSKIIFTAVNISQYIAWACYRNDQSNCRRCQNILIGIAYHRRNTYILLTKSAQFW